MIYGLLIHHFSEAAVSMEDVTVTPTASCVLLPPARGCHALRTARALLLSSSLPHCSQNETAAVHYLSCLLQPIWQAVAWKCWAMQLKVNHWPSTRRRFKELISCDGQMKLVHIRPQRSLWGWFSTIMLFSGAKKKPEKDLRFRSICTVHEGIEKKKFLALY